MPQVEIFDPTVRLYKADISQKVRRGSVDRDGGIWIRNLCLTGGRSLSLWAPPEGYEWVWLGYWTEEETSGSNLEEVPESYEVSETETDWIPVDGNVIGDSVIPVPTSNGLGIPAREGSDPVVTNNAIVEIYMTGTPFNYANASATCDLYVNVSGGVRNGESLGSSVPPGKFVVKPATTIEPGGTDIDNVSGYAPGTKESCTPMNPFDDINISLAFKVTIDGTTGVASLSLQDQGSALTSVSPAPTGYVYVKKTQRVVRVPLGVNSEEVRYHTCQSGMYVKIPTSCDFNAVTKNFSVKIDACYMVAFGLDFCKMDKSTHVLNATYNQDDHVRADFLAFSDKNPVEWATPTVNGYVKAHPFLSKTHTGTVVKKLQPKD